MKKKKMFLLILFLIILLYIIIYNYLSINMPKFIKNNDKYLVEFAANMGVNVNCNIDQNMHCLIYSIYEKQYDMAKLLINKGADVNCEYNKESPLIYSINFSQPEISEILINKGTNINCSDKSSRHCLIHSIYYKQYDTAKLLINKGANVNCEYNKESPLIYSIYFNQPEISELLINKGADLECRDIHGTHCLIYAIINNQYDTAKLLINKINNLNITSSYKVHCFNYLLRTNNIALIENYLNKIDINTRYSNGDTFLIDATRENNYEVILKLIERKININAKNNLDQTAWLIAKNNDYEDIWCLLEKNHASITNENFLEYGKHKLITAIENKNSESIEKLILKGANVNCEYYKESALIYSIYYNLPHVSKMLIDNNADVNCTDKSGMHCLIYSIYYNQPDVSEMIINKGANVNCSDKSGMPCLIYALYKGQYDTAKLLINKSANVNCEYNKESALIYSIYYNQPGISELLINKGANVNCTNHSGMTCLIYAINNKQYDTAKLLINKGADLNSEYNKESALIYSIYYNQLDISELLINKGANVNCADKSGKHCLIYAIYYEQYDTVKIIISKIKNLDLTDRYNKHCFQYLLETKKLDLINLYIDKCDPKIKLNGNNTLLIEAVRQKQYDVVRKLSEKNIDVNFKNNDNETAWLVAKRNNYDEIKMLLESHGALSEDDSEYEEKQNKLKVLCNEVIGIFSGALVYCKTGSLDDAVKAKAAVSAISAHYNGNETDRNFNIGILGLQYLKDYTFNPDFSRPYIRQEVKDEVFKNAKRDYLGRILDANTKKPINGSPDIGHIPGHEFWRESQKAEALKLTQPEFNDKMNNPKFYQIEDPLLNRSHIYEKKD